MNNRGKNGPRGSFLSPKSSAGPTTAVASQRSSQMQKRSRPEEKEQEYESPKKIDVIGMFNGEPAEEGQHISLKERLAQMQKRNLDIVDSIYEKADKRTTNQLSKLTSIDDHGVKHRLKEKTLAEENLEKIEKIVED
jgi:hypothetical protein